jgi:hypothetical protein
MFSVESLIKANIFTAATSYFFQLAAFLTIYLPLCVMFWFIVSVIGGRRWSGGSSSSSSSGITRTSRCASINVSRGTSKSKALLHGPIFFITSWNKTALFIGYWKGVTTCEFNVGLIVMIVATVSVVRQVIDDSTEIVWMMMGFLGSS